ncbi:MAG: uvrA [Bacteriovoracaceae bacterium]|nr:uvrA [Bacteriovoracaceae bacterium]
MRSTPPTILQKRPAIIEIRGASEHNLKHISLDIPRNQFIVITGPSGSGKSSLAFDTLFAEGQRRYIESLSAYAKQFVEQLKKPEVESIRGLCPAIAIQQKGLSKNPRSTAGTLTEIYDFLRLLYSRVGDPFCPNCHVPLSSQTSTQIVNQIFTQPEESRVNVMAVIARKRKGEFSQELNELVKLGVVRVRIDGQDLSLERGLKLEKQKPHTIEAYIDRLILKETVRRRLTDAVELAGSLASGLIQIENLDTKKTLLFNQTMSCQTCGFSFPELTPRLFSFNSPIGACETCRGIGYLAEEDAEEEGDDESESIATEQVICPTCQGTRLKREARSVFIQEKSIADIHDYSIRRAIEFFKTLKFSGNRAVIAEKILKEIQERLEFLDQVGLDYISLSRRAATLSGGEEQRIHLATQIGTRLTGVLYILDEPSIGLHQVDNQKLIDSLKRLKSMGNTVIVIEHDEETMAAADLIIDMGPGAGRHGGFIVDQGAPDKLTKGVTADYLNHKKVIAVPETRRALSENSIQIKKASLHNLKNIDITFPIGLFSVVTGVSGSGKSTLVMDVLSESLQKKTAIGCEEIKGLDLIDKLIRVDQSPIGRSPRSNPATYIGVFSLIRELFSQTQLSRVRGYGPGRFSFNVKGGRCEACRGAGELDIEMHFLADVSVPCETCGTRRYNSETLAVTFKGRNIFEVLEMTFDEAYEFFEVIPSLQFRLKMMCDVGLGYLKLGQPAVTLSGGEAQRVKLAKELAKRATGKTIYILDEPTTGLHFVDVQKLLEVVQQLVNMGSTVIMVEHHLDVIKSADYVIDLGPFGGERGGEIIVAGTPEVVAAEPQSKTGFYLKKLLKADTGKSNKTRK